MTLGVGRKELVMVGVLLVGVLLAVLADRRLRKNRGISFRITAIEPGA